MNESWRQRCNQIDDDATSAFLALCKRRNYGVTKSSRDDDMKRHIDFYVTRGNQTLKVELKGLKRLVDDGLFLIELRNVNGDAGWLYGEADQVAFYLGNDRFLFCPLKTLRDMIDYLRKLHPVAFVNGYPSNAVFPKMYRRQDRPLEAITYVTTRFLLDRGAVYM